jgi:hypothetical protein
VRSRIVLLLVRSRYRFRGARQRANCAPGRRNFAAELLSRWLKEYGGLELDQAKRMKELERENVRLKRLVAALSLENQVLKDIVAGNL